MYDKELYRLCLKALKEDEVPIAAIVVKNDEIIGVGYNNKEKNNDVTGHAEINALKDASKNLGTWKLDGCKMYITLEPCLMCYSAIKQSRITEVYIGNKGNDKKNYVYSNYVKKDNSFFYVDMSEKINNLLKEFFKNKRKLNTKSKK